MFTKKTITDIDLKNKTVLLRADYNVPLSEGKITDDYRIKQSIPTLKYLLSKNAKIVICSHLGRPKGPEDIGLSLRPAAKRLAKLLPETRVDFVSDCIGDKVTKKVSEMAQADILVLENLRFYKQEEANDKDFAKQLALSSGADVFVQDGFGVVHRAHASTEGVTHFLPSVAGLLLEKEVDTITNVMNNPKKPLMAIVGGAKIADKLEILKKFISIADIVAVGGAMANTFLMATKVDIGDSLYDKNELSVAKDIIDLAALESKKRSFVFLIPHDAVVAKTIDRKAKTRIVDWTTHVIADIDSYPGKVSVYDTKLASGEKILDVGPFSASFIAGAVQLASTVVWNGTLGVTEIEGLQGPIGPFAHGTEIIIEALTGAMGNKPFSVVGGGDTVGYVESRGIVEGFNHVSTGGGASLELMSAAKLPGVEALEDKK